MTESLDAWLVACIDPGSVTAAAAAEGKWVTIGLCERRDGEGC